MNAAAAALEAWRVARGLSRVELAAQVGVTATAVRGWVALGVSPHAPQREAIERVTEGAVPATLWPPTSRRVVPRRRVALSVLPLPATRGDCEAAARPCPHTRCRHHLDRDARAAHLVGREPSCALDLAAKGGLTLEEVGDVLGVSRERVRQIEDKAIRKFARQQARLYAETEE